jgi:hypothetical protein
MPALLPGARVSEIEARAALAGAAVPTPALAPELPAPKDPLEELRARAQELTAKDPARAANILKAWMAEESGNV